MNNNDIERSKYLHTVTHKLVVFTIICLFAWFGLIYVITRGESERTYLLLYVFLCGLIGGFVSIQQRLPTLELEELRQLSDSWTSIVLIPINGGIFALILMLLFLSGILEGTMFPKYNHTTIDHDNLILSFMHWMLWTFPQSGPDVAKLLFWSFLAGFSERLVPQIIRKVTEKVEKS